MPELMTIAVAHCWSNVYWRREVPSDKDPSVQYVVEWQKEYNPRFGFSEYKFTCTCKAYLYQKREPKSCKHIDRVKGNWCGWDQFLAGGETIIVEDKQCCPQCGTPVGFRQEAV